MTGTLPRSRDQLPPDQPSAFRTSEEVRRWLADFIVREQDPRRVLAVTAEVLGRFLRASRVCFGEINQAVEQVYFVLDWTCGVPSIQGPQPFYRESVFGRMYATGRTAVVDDYSTLPLVRNEAELLDEAGGRYFMAVPLLRGTEPVAVFAASDHRLRRWKADEVALMTAVGPMIWRAYEHLLALERLGEAERRLCALAGVEGSDPDPGEGPDPGGQRPGPAAGRPPDPLGGTISTFWLPTARGQYGLSVDQVDWIEASGDYALLHTGSGSHLLHETMASLERGLDPGAIMRVHRSAFVAVAAVRAVERIGRRIVLVLRDGTSVGVSAGYDAAVRARLGVVLRGRRVVLRPERGSADAAPAHIRSRAAPPPPSSAPSSARAPGRA